MRSAARIIPSIQMVALAAATVVVTLSGAVDAREPLVLDKLGSFFVSGRDLAVPYRSGRFISPTYERRM